MKSRGVLFHLILFPHVKLELCLLCQPFILKPCLLHHTSKEYFHRLGGQEIKTGARRPGVVPCHVPVVDLDVIKP